MAAELLAHQGAHNTEKLQVGWKAQWRRVTRLKIPKSFMQTWCIILREMNCACSEAKLLADCLFCRDIEMLTEREKLMDYMYTGCFFVPWSPIPWICKSFSNVPGVFMWEIMSDVLGPGTAERLQPWTSGGEVPSHPLSGAHGFIDWNYYSVGMLLPKIKMGFASNPIHRPLWGKKDDDDPWVDFQDQYKPTSMEDSVGSTGCKSEAPAINHPLCCL